MADYTTCQLLQFRRRKTVAYDDRKVGPLCCENLSFSARSLP
jgi:hypothetical protein